MILEICADSLESAHAAMQGGTQRIELCSALSEGGLTPSAGLMNAVCESLKIPVFVMIRPRGGDFLYSAGEFAVMKRDIDVARQSGASGVVLGLLSQDGSIDIERTRALVELARPMQVTFHRAIDRAAHIETALEQVISTGADRVLTSGGKQTAVAAIDTLARLVALAGERIGIIVCGSIREQTVGKVARATNAFEFHAWLRRKTTSAMNYHNPELLSADGGAEEFARYTVSSEEVRALSEALNSARKELS
jgi:copper homeostasis protein